MSLVGRLEDLGLSDIFQILSVGRKTGTLIINSTKGSAIIVFKNGLVSRAEGDVLDHHVGEDLLSGDFIKQSSLDMALDVKKTLPEKSISEILFELGAVKKEVLERVAKKRIEKLIYHLLLWQDGDFQFELDELHVEGQVEIFDQGWEMAKGLSPEYLLMEGARVHDEHSHGLNLVDEDLVPPEGQWEDDWAGQEPSKRKDISSLMALTQELRFPNTTSEITLLILRFASDMFLRGVLFMVGEDRLIGLGQFGLHIDDADEKIRQTNIKYAESPFLSKILDEGIFFKGPVGKDDVTLKFMDEIGEVWSHEAALFPIITEGRAVALLYCDNVPSNEAMAETEGLEIFISQAGLALEKAILQRKILELEKRNGNSS